MRRSSQSNDEARVGALYSSGDYLSMAHVCVHTEPVADHFGANSKDRPIPASSPGRSSHFWGVESLRCNGVAGSSLLRKGQTKTYHPFPARSSHQSTPERSGRLDTLKASSAGELP